MTTTRARTAPLFGALAGATLIALTGCAPILDTLQNEKTSTFPSASAVVEEWDKSAPWLPDDATQISVRETPDGAPAVLLASSSVALDSALCVEVDRQSAPVFSVDGAPDPYVDQVFACGDWAVMATDDGWYGWTPNHPDEQAASTAID